MGGSSEYRLFSVDDLLSNEVLQAGQATARGHHLGTRPDLDAAEMYLSREDGLLVRGVWPHSARKSWMVSRIIDVVSRAMTGKWGQLGYIELYSGPGRLLDRSTSKELPGSPVEALRLSTPFDRYVFCDFDEDCVTALRQRCDQEPMGSRSRVFQGDAKEIDHLERVARQFGRGTLVIAYLDPARPRDMTWHTVQTLANRLPTVDLIINLPVHSLQRAISGPHGRNAEAHAAGAFLGHPEPSDLMHWDRTHAHQPQGTMDAIRGFYDRQLQSLGFLPPARRIVEITPGVPYYDVLYASRHPLGVNLWNKANPPEPPPPSLLDGLDQLP